MDHAVLSRPDESAQTCIESIKTSADISLCPFRPDGWLAQAAEPVSVV
jgi:hypothetical protein